MPSRETRGLCVSVAIVAAACGPSIAIPGDDAGQTSTPAAESTGTDSSRISISSTAAPMGDDSTPGHDEGDSIGPVLDVAPIDDTGPPPDPGTPPETCEIAMRANASASGASALGEIVAEAVVFAENGGAKCPVTYRLVFAPSVDALDGLVATIERGSVPDEVLLLELELPDDGIGPGAWEGAVQHLVGGTVWIASAIAEVELVTTLDVPAPHIQGSFSAMSETGSVSGTFSAPYCARVRGEPCGLPD